MSRSNSSCEIKYLDGVFLESFIKFIKCEYGYFQVHLGSLLVVLFATDPLQAISEFSPQRFGYARSLNDLTASLALPFSEKSQFIQPTVKQIQTRIFQSEKDVRVETVHLYVPADLQLRRELAVKLAPSGKASELYDYMAKRFDAAEEKLRSNGTKKVALSSEVLKFIQIDKLAESLKAEHKIVQLASDEIDSRKSKVELLNQLKGFLTKNQFKNVRQKLIRNQNIILGEDLLSQFAESMAGKFIAYRGPNCFHSALAFHGLSWAASQFVNVKKEKGYHELMINYDELWRIINKEFYEINPKTESLKYGDMVVFMDVDEEQENLPVDFRSIRHAATYLVGPYTFSKGSKSPDTPYSIKTMAAEWETWRRYSQNLGVKVFRRISTEMPAKKRPPRELNDWIY